MKAEIYDIEVGDVIYSRRTKRFAKCIEKSIWGFRLKWNTDRYEHDLLTNSYAWDEWCGKIPDEYIILTTDKEKFEAILRYDS